MPERTSAGASARRAGFSLVEVIVALAVFSLLVAAVAPTALREIDAGRRRTTRARLEALHRAMVGDPATGDHGYVGDMGGLPTSLAELNQQGAQPAYVIDANDGVGSGWNGPYAAAVAAAGVAPVDAWGVPIAYAPANAQVTSAGADRTVGTADDLVVPYSPTPTTGNVIVTVRGFQGGTEVPMTSAQVTVTVGASVTGVRQELATSGANPFTRNGVHLGAHGITATGIGAVFGGIVARQVAEVRRGNTVVSLVLAAP